MTWRYRMAGIDLDSDLRLVELAARPRAVAQCSDAVVRITCGDVDELPPAPHYDGTPVFLPCLAGGELVVPGVAAVLVHSDGTLIEVRRWRGRAASSDALVSHLVVDQAVPRVLVARGETVLHATCVADDGRAVAFLGASGAGKSTMAMGFCADGAALVADDCLVVRPAGPWSGVVAVPSYPSGRLRDDSARSIAASGPATIWSGAEQAAAGKVRVNVHGVAQDQALSALIILERGGHRDARFERLSPASALWTLASHAFATTSVPAEDTAAVRVAAIASLGRVRWLAERAPVLRLSYPSDLDALPSVRRLVRTTVATGLDP